MKITFGITVVHFLFQADDYLANVLMMKRNMNWQIGTQAVEGGSPKDSWIDKASSVTAVTAYYSPYTNMAVLPLAIAHRPLFGVDYPAYINYGALGYVIGHEMTHGFDNHGKKYDASGTVTIKNTGKCP